MSTDRPFNVRVAEALGWTQLHPRVIGPCPDGGCGDILLPGTRWAGRAPGNVLVGFEGCHDAVPPYGEDSPEGWMYTGPLMKRLRIGLMPTVCIMSPPLPGTNWIAKDEVSGAWSDHPEPLRAVCEVILTLAANGRLPR